MADLLSDVQHLEIRAALQEVLDTFHDTPVFLHIPSEDYVQEFMEDLAPATTVYEVNALVEYPNLTQSTVTNTEDGSILHFEVKAQIGIDDMDEVGLINGDGLPIFVPKNGHMVINEEKYEIVYFNIDGAFEQKNILCYIYGKKFAKTL